jgi:hypothetical protein
MESISGDKKKKIPIYKTISMSSSKRSPHHKHLPEELSRLIRSMVPVQKIRAVMRFLVNVKQWRNAPFNADVAMRTWSEAYDYIPGTILPINKNHETVEIYKTVLFTKFRLRLQKTEESGTFLVVTTGKVEEDSGNYIVKDELIVSFPQEQDGVVLLQVLYHLFMDYTTDGIREKRAITPSQEQYLKTHVITEGSKLPNTKKILAMVHHLVSL